MRPLIEPGSGFKSLKEDWRCESQAVFSALTAVVFVLSGAIPMLASVANNAGMTPKQAVSFVMCSMLIGIRQPLLPHAVLLCGVPDGNRRIESDV